MDASPRCRSHVLARGLRRSGPPPRAHAGAGHAAAGAAGVDRAAAEGRHVTRSTAQQRRGRARRLRERSPAPAARRRSRRAAGGAADRADLARARGPACGATGRAPTRRSAGSPACAATELALRGRLGRARWPRTHTLTADRLEPTFLVLRTNTRFWARAPLPATGWRTTFGTRPRDLPVLPRPRPAAPAAGQLGPRERDRRRLPGRAAHAARASDRCRSGGADRAASTGCAALGARAQRLPRVGVLLRLRQRDAAVGERDDAGDRGPGAVARLPGAREDALAAHGAARARRLRAAAADTACRCPPRAGATTSCTRSRPAPRVQRRPAGRDRPARRRRAAALARRSPSGCSSAATARRGARSPASTPAPGRCTPTRGAESTLSYHDAASPASSAASATALKAARLLQRRRALQALRAASRRRSPSRRCARSARDSSRGDAALHALEGLDREGARVGHARAQPVARPAAPARAPRVAWRPPGRGRYRLRIEARGPSGPPGVELQDDPGQAAQAEAQAQRRHAAPANEA